MKKSVPIFVIILFLTTSCFYTDNETFRVEITSEYNPTISFTSNLDTIDNIKVTDSLLFSYSVSIDSGSLFFSDIYLGNLQLYRSDTVSDSLWIYPEYASGGGNYKLTLISYFKTYSGSLADKLDAEFLAADTSWTLEIIKGLVK